VRQECRVGRRGNWVVITSNGRGIGLSWPAAVDFYLALKRRFEEARRYAATGTEPADLGPERVGDGRLVVRRFGLMVLVELDGRLWLEAPHESAYEVGKAAYTQAKEVEADTAAVAERQIADQALLWCLGIPLQLTSDQRKLYEAGQSAAACGGIRPRGSVGRPTVAVRPPARRCQE
jgi:hypothetical protein